MNNKVFLLGIFNKVENNLIFFMNFFIRKEFLFVFGEV